YNELPDDEHRDVARWLFLRLIDPGTNEQDTTRRRMTQRDMETGIIKRQMLIHTVQQSFIDARLLVSNTYLDERGREQKMLEVAHEALIREWGQLAQWVNSARDEVRFQNQVAKRAESWENYNRAAGWLQGVELL